jgi:hypothetical protein
MSELSAYEQAKKKYPNALTWEDLQKPSEKYLSQLANRYGFAWSNSDIEKGLRPLASTDITNLQRLAQYNWTNNKDYDFGGLDFDPTGRSGDEANIYASLAKKLKRIPTQADYNKYYTTDVQYKGQYGNAAEDQAAYKAGQAPMRVQYSEKLRRQYNALAAAYNAGNLSQEKARELAPDLYALTGYAKEQEAARARAEGKAQAASYPPRGTKQSVNGDWLDPEVLKLLGYDEKTGFAKLFEGLPQTQVDIMEARLMPTVQQKAANARRLPQVVQGGSQSSAASGGSSESNIQFSRVAGTAGNPLDNALLLGPVQYRSNEITLPDGHKGHFEVNEQSNGRFKAEFIYSDGHVNKNAWWVRDSVDEAIQRARKWAGEEPQDFAKSVAQSIQRHITPEQLENADDPELDPKYWEKTANQTTNTLKWSENPTDGGNAYVSNAGKEGRRYVIVPTQDGRYALMWMSDNETSFGDYKGQIELFSNPNYAKWAAEQYRNQIDAGVKLEDIDSKERYFLWLDRVDAWRKDPRRNPLPGGYVSKGDENTWWGKLWEGNAFGGITGILSIPQELYLNAWNMGMQAGKGEKIQARPGMTNRDYMRENAERFGGTDLGAELDKAGALGAIANFSLEMLTDPTNFLPGGLVYDALRARGLANPKNLRYVQEFTNEKVLGQRYNPVSDDARGLVHPQITADDVKLAEAQNAEYAGLNAAKDAPEITPTIPTTRQAGSLDELFPPAARPEVTMPGTGADMPRLPVRVDDPNLSILGKKPATTISPRTPLIDTSAPTVRTPQANPLTAAADDSARALEEGLGLAAPAKNVPLAVEAAQDIKKPFVAIAGDAESALPRVKGFDTPEAARAWAEGTDGASVYKVTGRDAGGKVKALEPVQTEVGGLAEGGASPAGAMPNTSAAGVENKTKVYNVKTGQWEEPSGFLKGLDEGMGELPEPRNAGPETIDFTAEGGNKNILETYDITDTPQIAELNAIDINKIVPTAPVEIPQNAQVVKQSKTGYNQIKFKWSDNTYKYEIRWHTRTPGAPKSQGDTWVVMRTTPGTPNGKLQVEHIMIGQNKWVTMREWKAASNAWRNGVATPEQLSILESGHWPADLGGK